MCCRQLTASYLLQRLQEGAGSEITDAAQSICVTGCGKDIGWKFDDRGAYINTLKQPYLARDHRLTVGDRLVSICSRPCDNMDQAAVKKIWGAAPASTGELIFSKPNVEPFIDAMSNSQLVCMAGESGAATEDQVQVWACGAAAGGFAVDVGV